MAPESSAHFGYCPIAVALDLHSEEVRDDDSAHGAMNRNDATLAAQDLQQAMLEVECPLSMADAPDQPEQTLPAGSPELMEYLVHCPAFSRFVEIRSETN